MNVLSRFPEADKETVHGVLERFKEENAGVRAAADRALARLAVRMPRLVAESLNGDDEALLASPALAKSEPDWAKQREGVLRTALRTAPSLDIRRRAAKALCSVEKPAEETLTALRGVLKSESPELRAEAWQRVNVLFATASDGELELRLRAESDPALRELACEALGTEDPSRFLLLLAGAKDSAVILSLLAALPPVKATPLLTRALLPRLRSDDESIKSDAIRATARLLTVDDELGEELLRILRTSPSDGVRLAAITAIGHCGKQGGRAVPELTKLAAGDRLELRLATILALAQLGPFAAEAAPSLARLMGDSRVRTEVRGAAARALRDVAPSEPRCFPALFKALKDPEADIAQSAWTALGNCGRPAMVALLRSEFLDENHPPSSNTVQAQLRKA